MSLSQQYLDELSRRYKKQVEEMQKTFNKTIAALEVTARDAESRDELQQEMIRSLQSQILELTTAVAGVLAEKEAVTWKLVQRHMVLMAVEVLVLSLALMLCLRRRRAAGVGRLPSTRAAKQTTQPARQEKAAARRQPREVATDGREKKHRRRPSDEVVNISGTYHDLLISEGSAGGPAPDGGRRARRLMRSTSTWSVDSEEAQQLAVPGVGVLFAGPPSPAVAFVSRRGAAAAPAAVSNPYSPLRRLENGDGAAPAVSPPPPPPPPPLTNGHCHPPPAATKERRERRRVKKKLNLP
ncbi:formin-like protein 16 [Amphibalanus amphitrite]|uniref:formin-like protein 16 n=1 Tax=Amphibalanus amphitrite TaxID=1232801 RepID=UPI001C90F074|nr:formin-like protein 16 [Amphibalanus amphitrite]